MVKSARCLASYDVRAASGDSERNPFCNQGHSLTPEEMADAGIAERHAMRRRMKRIRKQYRGEQG